MLPQQLWQQFRAHHKVFLLLLVVPQPQTYLGAHQQATAVQPLLLIRFSGLAAQLLLQVHLLVLVVLPLLQRIHLLCMQLTPQALVRVQQVIQLVRMLRRVVKYIPEQVAGTGSAVPVFTLGLPLPVFMRYP
jgi:hypothetical protein